MARVFGQQDIHRLTDSSSIVPPPNKARDLHGTFIYKYWAFDREKRNVYIVITIYIKHKSARISL